MQSQAPKNTPKKRAQSNTHIGTLSSSQRTHPHQQHGTQPIHRKGINQTVKTKLTEPFNPTQTGGHLSEPRQQNHQIPQLRLSHHNQPAQPPTSIAAKTNSKPCRKTHHNRGANHEPTGNTQPARHHQHKKKLEPNTNTQSAKPACSVLPPKKLRTSEREVKSASTRGARREIPAHTAGKARGSAHRRTFTPVVWRLPRRTTSHSPCSRSAVPGCHSSSEILRLFT